MHVNAPAGIRSSMLAVPGATTRNNLLRNYD
jgi:hypothetical protein